ncbi:MAG: hypothetical protein Q8941_18500 [Bacteroidota bacterium]|nr:hypothetical protein [Bacteroidota bacterium]
MKKNKIVMVAVMIAAGFTVSYAFTGKDASKPIIDVVKLYSVSSNIVIEPHQSHSIIPSELDDQGYWDNGSLGPHGGITSLQAIQFQSNQFTFQQAIDGVTSYYLSYSRLPTDGNTLSAPGIGGVSYNITVFTVP